MNAAVQPGFFGHRVLAATFVLAIFGWGVGFYGPPVFLHAVVERTQWPVALVSAAVTAHFVVGALVVANLPRLYRAWGTPRITLAGAVLSALGTCGWAWAQAPWQLFLAAAVSGAGWVGLGAAAVNALIAPWFAARRPWALAMAYNGASVGGVIFSPLWVLLIGTIGFGGATVLVGVAMVACLAWLCGSVFALTPRQVGQLPDGLPAGQAMALGGADVSSVPPVRSWRADRRFVTLAGAMALGLFAQIGLIAHLYSLLAPMLGERVAGMAMGLATGCAILGRSLAGWLVPAGADRRLAACASYALQVLGSVVLWIGADGGDAPVLIWLGVALFGLGIGNATSLPPTIAQAEFARADALRAVPLMVAIAQGGYAFAPAAFGALRALQGAAAPGLLFGVAALVQGAAIASLLAGRRRLPAAAAARRSTAPERD